MAGAGKGGQDVVEFSRADIDALAQILRAAARSEILPRFRRLDAGAVRTKSGPLDLVTEADEAAEAAIFEALAERLPSALLVGEESAARNPALLEGLERAELAIVVDPIDGTSNYAAGVPLFGVMAAALCRGEVVASVILDPVTDHAAIAAKGGGAWTEDQDGRVQPLMVADATGLAHMTGYVSTRYLPSPLREHVMARLHEVAAHWDFRCAAHEYRMVAGGQCHFLMFNRLLPWDHLPGWLLHREAGGFAAHFDGTDYRAGDRGGGLLYAPDRQSWGRLRETLIGATCAYPAGVDAS